MNGRGDGTLMFSEEVEDMFALRMPVVKFVVAEKEEVKRPELTPLSDYLDVMKQYNEESMSEEKESGVADVKENVKKRKQSEHQQRLKDALLKYDPECDKNIHGDVHCTVFVGRLSYATSEEELSREFGKYGAIKHIRLVEHAGKSRGYAFIVYNDAKDARTAVVKANGTKIKDRRVVVDVERGRLVKNWKPRRLGGGLGGRNRLKKSLRHKPTHFSGHSNTYGSKAVGYGTPAGYGSNSGYGNHTGYGAYGNQGYSQRQPQKYGRSGYGFTKGRY